jgi:hypothetical protein
MLVLLIPLVLRELIVAQPEVMAAADSLVAKGAAALKNYLPRIDEIEIENRKSM